MRVLPSERLLANQPEGTPLQDSKAELPPVIRRTEVVAFALVALLIIVIAAVLYLARAFFLPITMAFIVGTMLSPAAGLLERYRIPRAVGAVLIVTAVSAAVTFMIGLIASPMMEWSSRLPQLGGMLKEKLHVFDRPLALWQELQTMLGGPATLTSFQMPKFEWVQPTLEFLSPTFADIPAVHRHADPVHRELEGSAPRADHDLWRTHRTASDIADPERDRGAPGNYLLMVTMINTGVGVATGLICAVTGMPNPAGLGALAAILNFVPIIGPIAMFAVLTVVGVVAFPDHRRWYW